MAVVLPVIVLLTPTVSRADLVPEIREVKEAVARALKYLETSGELRLGGKALIGTAYLKAGEDPGHPKVQEALEAVVEAARTTDIERKEHVIYSTALCIIFLGALDPVEYSSAIETHLERLISLQKPHGGWGYGGAREGDTSMTQLAVLALWEAIQGGVQVPPDVWSKVTGWLLRTQDPSGGYGYQGEDPGSFNLRNQSGVRISLTSGALGSLYVIRRRAETPVTREPRIAAAGDESLRGQERRRQRDNSKPRPFGGRMRQALGRGQGWMRENFEISPLGYTHYFLYALERYQTFCESAGDKPWPKDWYDQGARHLIATQDEDGSWYSYSAANPTCDTAFAVLFLVRSTKQSLGMVDSLGSGMLVGGRGLPPDLSGARLRNGRLVGPKFAASADRLLSLMEDPSDPDYLAAVEAFKEDAIQFDAETMAPHVKQLQKLMAGKDERARAAAIRGLARRRNLDDVPLFIAALEDGDRQVAMAARDALVSISRRPQGFGLSNDATEQQRRNSVASWKAWFRSLRPDAKIGG